MKEAEIFDYKTILVTFNLILLKFILKYYG